MSLVMGTREGAWPLGSRSNYEVRPGHKSGAAGSRLLDSSSPLKKLGAENN